MDSLEDIASHIIFMKGTAKTIWCGDGHVYLLVGWKGKNYLLAKTVGGWFDEWEGQKSIVQSLEDAIRVVNCNGCGVKDSEPGAVIDIETIERIVK